MDCNFPLSTIEQGFHYLTLSATGCVGIADNFSQKINFLLGVNGH